MPTPNDNSSRILFWDMAGTLIGGNRSSGSPRTLPGIAGALERLRRNYTLCLTTGDFQKAATDSLRQAGLLKYFHQVYGEVWAPVGKPYGAISAQRGVAPERCLAFGDRLGADIPSDTDRLVTVLINQSRFTLHAEAIVALVDLLAEKADDFLGAFHHLIEAAEPLPAAEASKDLGEKMWRFTGDLDFELAWYRHPVHQADRPIILLPG